MREIASGLAVLGSPDGLFKIVRLAKSLSEISGFRKRSFSNEAAWPRISGRLRLSETCSKTAPKGNWCWKCSGFAVRSDHRMAKRTI